MTSSRRLAIAASFVLIAGGATAAARPGDGAAATVIRDVTIIDVEAGRAVPHRSVLIRGELIEAIHPAATYDPPAGAAIVDGAGRCLIPGLFDAHVHLSASPETYGPLLLAHGVTCVRDMGADTRVILDLRRRAAERSIECPRIVCTGAIIDGDPPYWPFSMACDTEEDARAAVRALHDAGVDQIKLYTRLRPEVHRAAIEEARALGLKPVGHVPDAVSLRDAVAAGQASIEHLTGFERLLADLAGQPLEPGDDVVWSRFEGFLQLDRVDPERLRPIVRAMREAGTANCPTIVVMAGLGRATQGDEAKHDPRLDFVPASVRSFWDAPGVVQFGRIAAKAVDPFMRIVRMLHDAGVTLMVGTDLANPYVFAGSSVHDEMALFARAGIPNADVLRDATIVPARFCEVDDRLGSIAPGKEASLVLLDRDPLEDIEAVREIAAVVHRGRVLDRDALDALLEEVRAFARSTVPLKAEVALDVPGEVLRRGRYVVRLGPYDAGEERFVISRTPDGYFIKAHSRPEGGYMPPSVMTIELNEDFTIRSARWQRLTESPLEARYTFTEGGIRAEAVSSDEAPGARTMALPEGPWLVSTASYASKFATLNECALAVGETREFRTIGFGGASWEPVAGRMTITRHDDTTITIDGAERAAHRYTSALSAPGVELTAESWTDDRNVLLRQKLKLPYGAVDVTLDEPPAAGPRPPAGQNENTADTVQR